ncbi:hypothetical protein A1O1_02472 [Capronia coronata CBS 617.96]|uniref:Amidase domain-containing protein n=1 Tax=Capronia coronata CBS 617.96 TaxID=1182541 RepID=W9ZHW3_9EURO|nr:uncharacterized protein A1O1_02472 [Capronia coronata CBS 617.96]EXJ94079.1 hypothetical protein A1O1_02472 [Capronia coronata CBS 617.96]
MQIVSLPQLSHTTLSELQDGLQSGAFTSEDLVRTYLKRIEEVNDRVHAVVEVNSSAVETARALDEERRLHGHRGPWHGVPVLIKDSIATTDMENTSGSYALSGATIDRDASVVQRLRAAGAIVLGTTNLSQWGNARSSDANNSYKSQSSNGWSATGGQTYGVYHVKQDPSGSSSGSAVATSLGLALAAVGNETDGSIICPAGRSAVVGIKPTPGLTPRDLVILPKRIGTVGVMAQTVEDAAALLTVIAGACPHDRRTEEIPFDEIPDYRSFCRRSALRGARIGIPRNAFQNNDGNVVDAVELAALEETISIMAKAGAVIVDPAEYPEYATFFAKSPSMKAVYNNADWKAQFEDYVARLTKNPQNIHTISDLVEFTKTCPAEEYPSRNIDGLLHIEKALSADDPSVEAAFEQVRQWAMEGCIQGAVQRHQLDALILPSGVSTTVAAAACCPVINVPWGYYPKGTPLVWNGRGNLLLRHENTPFGLSFIGLPFTEHKLIAYSYAFEQLTRVRDRGKQYITPTTELDDVLDSSSTNNTEWQDLPTQEKQIPGSNIRIHLHMTASQDTVNV